jgi:hypothetical protein
MSHTLPNNEAIKAMTTPTTQTEFQVDEGNLKAVKDTPTWVGDNWWIFYVKNTNGMWDRVSRMDVSKIQKFFNTKLPVY